jgi:DNA modification methylase
MTIDRDIHNNINQIILGNALTELKKLPDSFIDVCVTSPPYWNQTWGEDPNIIGNESTVSEYVDNLIRIFGQVKRVLKKSGSCFVVLSDKFNNGGDG